MNLEIEVYSDILEEYYDLDDNVDIREIWKVNSLIKLMNFSRKLNDKKMLHNGMILISSLSNGVYKDKYNQIGKDIKSLLKPETDILDSILKEVLN